MKKLINMINPASKVAGVSLLELKKTEKELGALFPEEYKELFKETNGANFGDWKLYPIPVSGNSELIIDIIKQNREKKPENLPSDMICIGENINGDRLCFRVRKKFMQEQIYLWTSKTEEIDSQALSLSHFIEWFIPRLKVDNPKTIGTFIVESGELIVTDPAYGVDEKNTKQIKLSNVKKGEWTARITYTEEDYVQSLQIFYGKNNLSKKWNICDDLIGVDSGQAGIFDISLFGRDSAIPYEVKNVNNIEINRSGLKYYVACADMVTSDFQGGIVPGGAVSMSGYGDGLYSVEVNYNVSKELIGVRVSFS